MYRSALTGILSIVLVGCDPAEPQMESAPFKPDSGTIAVYCGNVIDGLSDESIGARSVVIKDGRIVAMVMPGASNRGMAELDLSEHTCLPGLIDTHTHLSLLPEDADDYTVYLRRTHADNLAIAADSGAKTIDAGFTTVRNVADYWAYIDRDARDLFTSGKAIGPRVQPAGYYLTIPHGGGDMYIPGIDDSEVPDVLRQGVARGADAFRERTQELVDNDIGVIKMIASGAVFGFGSEPGAPEMTLEEIAAVVEVGKAAGIPVTAHAHGAQSIKDAITAGVDAIEHASLADDEAIAMAAENQVAFSMDVYNGTYTAEVGEAQNYPEEFMRKNEETTEAQRIVFEKAYAAGVPILFGTDTGVLPHGMNAKQFSIMVERGMSPMDAIKAATSVAAVHMRMADDVGALEQGRYGDLIAVRGNPLDDISVLENVDIVIKGGLILKME